MKVAVHQPNFIPWFPFFYKMAMADKFVIMTHCQFEKNGYQNRYQLSSGKWVTKSVNKGLELIEDKKYSDGLRLQEINCDWIIIIARTLGIDVSKIRFDHQTHLKGTSRIIELVKRWEGTTYITNPEAKNKYLDEEKMKNSGIKVEYCVVPKHLHKHTFEIFEEYGIDGAIKQLPKRELCLV